MREVNPRWEELKAYDFSLFIPENVLKHRADEVFSLLECKSALQFSEEIHLEIGSNRGRFLVGLAQNNPEASVVGIEMKTSLVRISNKKLQRLGCDRAFAINADANLAIPTLFSRQSIDFIYVLFPDPWWKKKHKKRRLLSAEFFDLMDHFLKPGAFFVIKTDVCEYFEAVKETVFQDTRYRTVSAREVPGADKWSLTTRERYCLKNSTPYYTLCLRHEG